MCWHQRPDLGTVLLKLRKILQQAFYSAGCEETDDVVIAGHHIADIITDDPVQYRCGIPTVIRLEPVCDLAVE